MKNPHLTMSDQNAGPEPRNARHAACDLNFAVSALLALTGPLLIAVRKTIVCMATILAAFSTAANAAPDLSNSYRLEAQFDPATGALSVDGSMEFVADQRRDSLTLFLNDGLTVRSVTADGVEATVLPQFKLGGEIVPGVQSIVVPLAKPLEQGDTVTLRFQYEGQITTDQIQIGRGVVSPAWTELTLEAAWYPISIDEPLIRSELILEVPKQYEVAGPGLAQQIAPGRWRLDPQTIVAGRITFALSDSWLKQDRALGSGLTARLYTLAPEPRANELLGAVEGAYAAFFQLFGPPRVGKPQISLLYPNVEIGMKYPNQAYATASDFIVLSTGENKGQIETLQHEVAHLWWSLGQPGTPDEFLLESTSEYLANRRGGELFGPEWLRDRRAELAAQSAAIKASFFDLAGHGTGPRQPLLYYRGPAALWLLHDRIGEGAMNTLLQEAYKRNIATLEAFLELIGEQHGAEMKNWFQSQL